jgi:hypothetical protein
VLILVGCPLVLWGWQPIAEKRCPWPPNGIASDPATALGRPLAPTATGGSDIDAFIREPIWTVRSSFWTTWSWSWIGLGGREVMLRDISISNYLEGTSILKGDF